MALLIARRHRGLFLAFSLAFAPLVFAFNLNGERWPAGSVPMHLQLGPTSGPLLDGATSWGAAAEDALAAWNRSVANVRFVVVRDSTEPIARGNARNNVFFSATVYGAAWGNRTLGITLQTFDQRTRRYSETDVIFNSNVRWDSYRGPVRVVGGENLNDFRRVAIHEFGHALGLDHPDALGQTVPAVMNSLTGDVDAPTADDIAGVRAIYDSPAAAASLLGFTGATSYSTLGNQITWRIGGVRNDGDITSGAIRIELWASPERFVNRVPAGAYLLGTYPLGATVPPGAALTDLTTTNTFSPPPNGSYYTFLLLTEATGTGGTFAIRDSLQFTSIFNVGPPTAPVIIVPPASVSGTAGAAAAFAVTATGTLPLTYQWRKDGTAIAGATDATLTVAGLTPASAGSYTVVVTNSLGSATSAPAALLLGNPADPGRLVNMSIRTTAGTGDNTLIVGVAIGGAGTSGNKAALFRAVGPTLGAFGVGGALSDTLMVIVRGDGAEFARNDDWAGGFDFGSVGAFGLLGSPPRDSGIYNAAIPGGSYSIQILGKDNATGVALAEIYDATSSAAFTRATPRLVNVSARTEVGTGDAILIAGFAIGGTTPLRVLVRAVGPTLGAFGVGGTLVDPRLEILSGSTRVAENDNWLAADAPTFGAVGAFNLTAASRDAALVTFLAPGTYTAQISGVGGTTGVALVEVYEVP